MSSSEEIIGNFPLQQQNSNQVCPECGSTSIRKEDGDVICSDCGRVIDSTANFINELHFDDSGRGGGKILTGKIYGETERKRYDIERQMKAIRRVGEMLKMKTSDIESGERLYKVAIQRGITKGRKAAYSAGACLYIICRRERTDHLLIDFADILHVSVRKLGRTFVRFCEELKLDLPFVDPCLYLQRFAEDLGFGQRTGEVVRTAMRICQRMNRDWMHYGRRPSGICGVALYLAGRIHGEVRSLEDVVQVVRLSATTVRVRLKEFLRTPSADLTVQQLKDDKDVAAPCQPPSYTLNRMKDKIRREIGANVPLRKRRGGDEEFEIAEDKKLTEEIECLIGGEITKNILEMKDIDQAPRGLGSLEGKSARDVGVDDEVFDIQKIVDVQRFNEDDFIEDDGIDEGEDVVGDCAEFDNELDGYFLDQEESNKRKQIWEELNADFLIKEKNKMESGETTTVVRRKREKKSKKMHQTVEEALGEQLKKKTSRINWDVLGKMIEQTEKLAKGDVDVKIEVKEEVDDPPPQSSSMMDFYIGDV
ncbi:Transcription initiation factor IIIB chain BRF [Entamoeba marina]